MPYTKDFTLPTDEELTVEEVNLSLSALRAGAIHLGKYCEKQNNEFILCRNELDDPRKCLNEGKMVTKCTLEFFRKVKKHCCQEFNQFANCLDRSSTDMSFKYCRNTQAAFDKCALEKMKLEKPPFGWQCEVHIHEAARPKPKPELAYYPDAPDKFPVDEIKVEEPKYGVRGSREQPIFTCKAHVFHIDPKTKRFWLPASNTAVSVSFFYDSTRSLYRIISVEGAKAVINSTITPNMTFTKTSQKFGQWSDVRANTVYGLGFSSEPELNKFIEKFQEVKEATKLEASKKAAADGTAFPTTPVTSANASPITGRAGAGGRTTAEPIVQDGNSIIDPPDASLTNPPPSVKGEDHNDADKNNHGRSQSLSGLQPGESPKHQVKTEKISQISVTPGSGESQLKYENDRLKMALAQSSANAKKWEIELATLKSNNARLTSALQESTANVEEWKRQLHSYKEENVRLKTRYLELEAVKGSTEAAVELRKELNSLRQRVEQLELESKAKDDEIKRLTKNGGGHDDRCKSLSQENAELQAAVSLAQAQLETALAAQESQRRVLDTLNAQLATRVAELAGIHREVATALQT